MLTVWQATDYCPMMEETRQERLAGREPARPGLIHRTHWPLVRGLIQAKQWIFIQKHLINSLLERCWLQISRQFSTFTQGLPFYLPSDERVVKDIVHHEKQIYANKYLVSNLGMVWLILNSGQRIHKIVGMEMYDMKKRNMEPTNFHAFLCREYFDKKPAKEVS